MWITFLKISYCYPYFHSYHLSYLTYEGWSILGGNFHFFGYAQITSSLLFIYTGLLTKRLGADIEAIIDKKGRIEIWRFRDTDAYKIPHNRINRQILQELRQRIPDTLLKASILKDYHLLRHRAKTIVSGTILKTDPDLLYVELKDTDTRIIAICHEGAQTPKERGRYKEGETLSFYLLSIHPVYQNGIPRLVIRLSRTSRGLVEGLLKRETGIDLRCECRIAGAYSHITATAPIPRDTIKEVSDQLKERIIVRWKRVDNNDWQRV